MRCDADHTYLSALIVRAGAQPGRLHVARSAALRKGRAMRLVRTMVAAVKGRGAIVDRASGADLGFGVAGSKASDGITHQDFIVDLDDHGRVNARPDPKSGEPSTWQENSGGNPPVRTNRGTTIAADGALRAVSWARRCV